MVGNLGKDPEIKQTTNGNQFAKFSMATTEKRKDGDKTEWHNVVVWDEYATKFVGNYLKKGSQVYLEGKIETRTWDKDGEKRYATEIVVPKFGGVLMGGSKPEGMAPQAAVANQDNEIPFDDDWS